MSEEVKYTNTELGIDDGMRASVANCIYRLLNASLINPGNAESITDELLHLCTEAFMNGLNNGFFSGVVSKPGDRDFDYLKQKCEQMGPDLLNNKQWIHATSAATSDIYDQGMIDGWNAATRGDPTDPKYVQAKAIAQSLATPTITS